MKSASVLPPPPIWPLYGLADDMRAALRANLEQGPTAVATIIGLWGGGPRPIGTQMVFGPQGMAGFLSGGCIESDVAIHAASCLTDHSPRRLVYGRGSPWPDIRLQCGTRIEILVERLALPDQAASTLFALTKRRAPALWISDGRQRICGPEDVVIPQWPGAFVKRYDPIPRLVVVGHDPTALAIAGLGAQSGFETTLIWPNGPMTPSPLPGVAYSRLGLSQALADLGLDPWTAVAVCNHDQDLDDEALLTALPSSAPYVGLLGARNRLPERLDRLKSLGLHEEPIAKLRAPIGLNLGGKAPFEVAVAVIGEIMAARIVEQVGRHSLDQSPESQPVGAHSG